MRQKGTSGEGGAVYGETYTFVEVVNSIVRNNTSTFIGKEEISVYGTATATITHSNVKGSFVQGIWNDSVGTNGGGNIDSDPLFIDPDNGNFRLEEFSPCIDSGTNAPYQEGGKSYGVEQDLDGNPRIKNELIDMGAYEF